MAMSDSFNLDALLDSAPAAATWVEAGDILKRRYGLEGNIQPLSSERDANFRVDAADGCYLLKITNPAEDPKVTELQSCALRHLEVSAPTLPVPRIVETREGQDHAFEMLADQLHVVRLMSYLPGVPLGMVAGSARMRSAVGRALGELDAGLRGFQHPAADHDLLWNVSNALRVRRLIPCVQDERRRAIAEKALDDFEQHAVRRIPTLRTQVIHNDFNPHNILVAEESSAVRITGIIDFGDIIRAPLVNDVSTAIAYQDYEMHSPFEIAADVVAAYHERFPLMPEELDVIFDLVRARQVMVGAITAWRAARQPRNRSYILRNSARAWAGLESFEGIGRAEFRQVLKQACERSSK